MGFFDSKVDPFQQLADRKNTDGPAKTKKFSLGSLDSDDVLHLPDRDINLLTAVENACKLYGIPVPPRANTPDYKKGQYMEYLCAMLAKGYISIMDAKAEKAKFEAEIPVSEVAPTPADVTPVGA